MKDLGWAHYYDLGEKDAIKNVEEGGFGGLITTDGSQFSDVPAQYVEHYVCGYNHKRLEIANDS